MKGRTTAPTYPRWQFWAKVEERSCNYPCHPCFQAGVLRMQEPEREAICLAQDYSRLVGAKKPFLTHQLLLATEVPRESLPQLCHPKGTRNTERAGDIPFLSVLSVCCQVPGLQVLVCPWVCLNTYTLSGLSSPPTEQEGACSVIPGNG